MPAGQALGGDVYCMSGVHLYTPLPFLPKLSNLHTHFFFNAGNCGSVQNFSPGTFIGQHNI